MRAKTVTVKPHKRSTPNQTSRSTPKPGPKNVPVKPHKRSTQIMSKANCSVWVYVSNV